MKKIKIPEKAKALGSRLKPWWDKFARFFREKENKHPWNTWQTLLIQLVFSVGACFLIEAMSRHSVLEALEFMDKSTKAFLYNCMLIYLTSLPVFFFRRRNFYRTLVFGIWLIGGLVNGIVLANRVTPLTGPDLTSSLSEGLAVINKYFNTFQIVLIEVLIVVGLFFLIRHFFRAARYHGKMYYLRSLIGMCAAAAAFAGLTVYCINTRVLSTYFYNIAFAYEDYGFAYCISVTLFDTGISQPNNYSDELVESVLSESDSLEETSIDTDNLPNIIVVQLESFFDISRVTWLETSEDPLSNWHSLCEEYSSGYYTVPTVGAGTANTEFETLTGMSLRFFGAGEYPFKGILREQVCESSAFILNSLGYTSTAIHNNEANFYSRKVVFKNLGFDAFISEEYMDSQDDVNENGWMRDETLIQPIIDALDSSEGADYVFTVSVQAHGAYPTEEVIEDPVITVSTTGSDATDNAWEYYVNQLYEVDQFIADLIETIEERGEPTVILFYGDHLPTMDLEDSDLSGGNTYQTDYLIWDNIGLEEQDKDLAAYQALAEVMNQLGIHEGVMFRFQQSHTGEEEDFMADMQVLQYDILYGKQYVYGGSELCPWSISETYSLGVKTIEITSVALISDNVYYVRGNNFTQSCKILVDGEQLDPIYVNNHTLIVQTEEAADETTTWQIGVQSNSRTHKILSKSATYKEPLLISTEEESTEDTGTEITDVGIEISTDSSSESESESTAEESSGEEGTAAESETETAAESETASEQ